MPATFLRLFALVILCYFFSPLVVAEENRWRLVNGTGELVPPDILQVTGDGTGTAVWRSEPIRMRQAIGHYRFSVSHRGVDTSGGVLPCGIEGISRDFSTVANQWTNESFYFRRHSHLPPVPLRVGLWESTGTFQFRDVKLEPVVPVRREFNLPLGKIWLGEGETIRDGKYQFRSNFVGKGINTQHGFVGANATFNSNRWCFNGGSAVAYIFSLATRDHGTIVPFNDGKLVINVNYHTHGEGVIEISTDGQNLIELARINQTGTQEITLPEHIFPTEPFLLQIRGLDDCYFQVNRIDFEASLPETFANTDLHSLNLRGETLYATVVAEEQPLRRVHWLALTENNEIRIVLAVMTPPDAEFVSQELTDRKLIPLEKSRSPEEKEITFNYEGRTYTFTTRTHPLERSDYGYWSECGQFWWCETGWKVSRNRQPPEQIPETIKPIKI